MLVLFGLDVSALDSSYGDPVNRRANHFRFLEHWLKHGLLIMGGDTSNLTDTIKKLPQDLRKRWQEVLQLKRFHLRGKDWIEPSSILSDAEIPFYQGKVLLLILEETRALEVGLPHGQGAIKLTNPSTGLALEVCRFDYVDQSDSFTAASQLSSSIAPAGQKVSALWNERFKLLSKYIHGNVIIIDRYAGESHLNRRDGFSGLRRLLTEIDGGLAGRIVNIYTGQKDHSESDIITAIQSTISSMRRGGLHEVNIYLCPDSEFGRLAHYRYVRFDRTVCTIDVGVEIFAGETTYRACPINIRPLEPSLSDKEGELRNICNHHKIK